MIKKSKRQVSFLLSLIGVMAVLTILMVLGFKDHNVVRNSSDKISKLNYVLVNEDEGAGFEGKRYNLGNDFIYLINQDNTNNWETTSYSLANAGFKNGQYDVEIIIPHDFSQRLLSLNSINPKQALIRYKVRSGQNEISNKVVQQQIDELLKDFNQRIIKMYFSSIVGNLSEAQQNVSRIVDENNQSHQKIESTVYQPLKLLPDTYESLLDTASLLEDGHKEFNDNKKEFTDFIQEQLMGGCDVLTSSDDDLSDLQRSIKATIIENQKTANEAYAKALADIDQQSKAITEQWKEDKAHYDDSYHSIATTTDQQLTGLNADNGGGLNQLVLQINQFQKVQLENIDHLGKAIAELEKQKESLEESRKQLAEKYYGDASLTPDKVTDDQLNESLSKLLTNNGETVALYQQYKNEVDQIIERLPLEAVKKTLQYLEASNQISKNDYQHYQNEISIIEKYAMKYSLKFKEGNEGLYEENELNQGAVTVEHNKVTLAIDPSKENTLTIQPQQGDQALELCEINVDNLRDQLNKQLQSYHYTIDDIIVEKNKINIKKAKPTAEETTSSKEGQNNESQTLPQTISLVVDFGLRLELSDNADEVILPYQWISDILGEEETSLCLIQHHLGMVLNTSKVATTLNDLNSAAQQIVTLYGNPGQTITIDKYAEELTNHPDKDIETLADKHSMFYLYNETLKTGLITPEVLERYKQNINQSYQELTAQIDALQATIGDANTTESSGTLYGIYHLLTRPDEIVNQAKTLQSTYQEAQRVIKEADGTWKESEQIQSEPTVDRKDPLDGDSSDLENSTKEVVTSLRSLMNDSKKLASDTKKEAGSVDNISPEIKDLKKSTTAINRKTKGLINDTNQFITGTGDSNKKNNNYAKNFNTVLANAKNGGSDNPAVFNFLADPLSSQGKLGALSQQKESSLVPYYATLIGAMIALVTAFILMSQMKGRKLDEAHQMMEKTRIWENIPNITVIMTASTVVVTAFGGLLMFLLKAQQPPMSFFWYAVLIELGMILMLTVGLRSYKKLTIMIYLVLFGLFIMLSPLLGVMTRPGTLIYWLYRLSPLQNMQSGFTALLSGGSVGVFSYLFLIFVVIAGIVLNLFVKAGKVVRSDD